MEDQGQVKFSTKDSSRPAVLGCLLPCFADVDPNICDAVAPLDFGQHEHSMHRLTGPSKN